VLPSLARALHGRRSVREFADRPVPAALLAFACQAGIDIERAEWPTAEHGDTGIGIAAAVWDVAGLKPGIYRYKEEQPEFAPAGGGQSLVAELRSAYALAPALLLVYGDLDKARDSRPAQGYQLLLVRTGALGYASLLAALSAGLRGCLYGAASISASMAVRTGEARLHHLFTLAVGWPASDNEAT
jgi:hypothetical protein